jgi:hypothetical protein
VRFVSFLLVSFSSLFCPSISGVKFSFVIIDEKISINLVGFFFSKGRAQSSPLFCESMETWRFEILGHLH